jgi:hypothetical protein
VRSHAQASTAGPAQRRASGFGRIVRGALATRVASLGSDGSGALSIGRGRGTLSSRLLLACLVVVGAAGIAASPAAAVDNCPNAFFRTGPSANLPDCRAYEIVSPTNAGPHRVTMASIFGFGFGGSFPHSPIAPSADSVVFNTGDGALPGTAASGSEDRYRAVRGSDGWTTALIGPTGSESEQVSPLASTPDHQYYLFQVGVNSFTPNGGTLLSQLGITQASSVLQLPDGSFQMAGKGSLGTARLPEVRLITPGATHIVFVTDENDPKLEPNAPEPTLFASTIYDRSANGSTQVVSLLPDGTPTPSEYMGLSKDGTAVAFKASEGVISPKRTAYVRLDNAVTQLVAPAGGVQVGRTLTCSGGPGSATLSYQWLRNGAEIGGATSNTYTTTGDDASPARGRP